MSEEIETLWQCWSCGKTAPTCGCKVMVEPRFPAQFGDMVNEITGYKCKLQDAEEIIAALTRQRDAARAALNATKEVMGLANSYFLHDQVSKLTVKAALLKAEAVIDAALKECE